MHDVTPEPTATPEPVATDGAPATPDEEAAPAGAAGPRDAPGAAVRRQNRAAAIAAIALVVILAFAGGVAVGRWSAPAGAEDAAAPPSPAASSGATGAIDLASDAQRLGSADAAVVIDYWADFQCPFCSKFARETIPLLQSKIADGTVALVHRDFAFIGPESELAAVAVRCAAPDGRYWPMHDAVYAAQQGENQGAFSRDRLVTIAAAVGLDSAAFAACLDDSSVLVDVLDDTAAGIRSGVTSTPTIDVNGTRYLGVPDGAGLLATIDAALAGASSAPLPTAAPASDPWTGTPTAGRTAGDAAAPVSIELWMDYQSTDAKPIAESLEPELRSRISAGALRAELHDVAALGDDSVAAASFVRCVAAQDGPAWFVHDVLEVSAQGAGAGIFTRDNLLRLGSKLGLEVKVAAACLDDPATAAAVRAETADGQAAGITAGPTLIVRKGSDEIGRFTAPVDATAVLAAIDGAR